MRLRYQFRLDPSPGQRDALARVFGCARLVWNDALAMRKAAYKDGRQFITSAELSRQLASAKTMPERTFLSEVSAVALQQSLRDLESAYKNFFESVSGKRRGRRMGLPKFKSRKDSKQSIRLNANAFRITDTGKLRVARIGDITVKWSRGLPSAPSSVTVIKDATDRYFCSFVVEVDSTPLPPTDSDAGIDVGLNAFAVDDSGRVIDSPKFLRQAERKLRKLQQDLSRKSKGSSNRGKARKKVARQHARVGDRRRDFLHKQSTRLIGENQAVYLENLNVAGLSRNRRLAKSVHDAGWSTFRDMVTYKAMRYGRIVIDRWFPSTKMCSSCGAVKGTIPLGQRVFTCECGLVLGRDQNAAINIRNEGRRQLAVQVAAGHAETINACGGTVRPGVEIPCQACPCEAGTHSTPHQATTRRAGISAQ